MASSQPLIWMDLEMTGLDPEKDRILEIAVIFSDGQLQTLEEGPDLVVHQPDDLLAGMDAWNTEHHGNSGLVEMVKSSTLDEAGAEEQILAWLGERCRPRSVPLAGNSVHQDRAFLRRYMPRLHDFLHYRNVDVSTVKELVRRWAPGLLSRAPSKTGQHRALDDLHESIRELQFYRSHAFALQGESRDN
jgi:oligoribonuclease